VELDSSIFCSNGKDGPTDFRVCGKELANFENQQTTMVIIKNDQIGTHMNQVNQEIFEFVHELRDVVAGDWL
jgi:hypothetical protein